MPTCLQAANTSHHRSAVPDNLTAQLGSLYWQPEVSQLCYSFLVQKHASQMIKILLAGKFSRLTIPWRIPYAFIAILELDQINSCAALEVLQRAFTTIQKPKKMSLLRISPEISKGYQRLGVCEVYRTFQHARATESAFSPYNISIYQLPPWDGEEASSR
jgi:hypothetical protein